MKKFDTEVLVNGLTDIGFVPCTCVAGSNDAYDVRISQSYRYYVDHSENCARLIVFGHGGRIVKSKVYTSAKVALNSIKVSIDWSGYNSLPRP